MRRRAAERRKSNFPEIVFFAFSERLTHVESNDNTHDAVSPFHYGSNCIYRPCVFFLDDILRDSEVALQRYSDVSPRERLPAQYSEGEGVTSPSGAGLGARVGRDCLLPPPPRSESESAV